MNTLGVTVMFRELWSLTGCGTKGMSKIVRIVLGINAGSIILYPFDSVEESCFDYFFDVITTSSTS